MNAADKQPRFTIQDDAAVPQIYANEIVSGIFDGHAILITFGNERVVPERNDERPGKALSICVSCRVALSSPVAVELLNSTNNVMAAVQKEQNVRRQLRR